MGDILYLLKDLSNSEVMSIILLVLVLGDTMASCLWRNKKKVSIFSKSLWVGFAINAVGSAVPEVIGHLPLISGSTYIKLLLILWVFIFGSATGFSFSANLKLYSPKSYDLILKNVPDILKSEIENKISKASKKVG